MAGLIHGTVIQMSQACIDAAMVLKSTTNNQEKQAVALKYKAWKDAIANFLIQLLPNITNGCFLRESFHLVENRARELNQSVYCAHWITSFNQWTIESLSWNPIWFGLPVKMEFGSVDKAISDNWAARDEARLKSIREGLVSAMIVMLEESSQGRDVAQLSDEDNVAIWAAFMEKDLLAELNRYLATIETVQRRHQAADGDVE